MDQEPMESAIKQSSMTSWKNPFVMQLYSDILNMPVEVINAEVGPAQGSAVFAAVAAGCYENI